MQNLFTTFKLLPENREEEYVSLLTFPFIFSCMYLFKTPAASATYYDWKRSQVTAVSHIGWGDQVSAMAVNHQEVSAKSWRQK